MLAALSELSLWWTWGSLTVLLMMVLLLLPAEPIPPRLLERVWVWRLLNGEMGLGGSLRIGSGLSAMLWWGRTAGVLLPNIASAALVLVFGGIWVIAMLNAGRRADLSDTAGLCLGAGLSGIVGVLLLVVAELLGEPSITSLPSLEE